MSYSTSGFGNVYQIPTKSSSSVFPDMTLTMDVPVQKMSYDAYSYIMPFVESRVKEILPYMVKEAYPVAQDMAVKNMNAFVDAAYPRIQEKLTPRLMLASAAVIAISLAGTYYIGKKL